jgi:hypothetical protein
MTLRAGNTSTPYRHWPIAQQPLRPMQCGSVQTHTPLELLLDLIDREIARLERLRAKIERLIRTIAVRVGNRRR